MSRELRDPRCASPAFHFARGVGIGTFATLAGVCVAVGNPGAAAGAGAVLVLFWLVTANMIPTEGR